MSLFIAVLLLSLTSPGEKISRSASIILNGSATTVFPLFGAYEEKKWSKGWNPTPVYPSTETIEDEATFTTPGHLEGEKDYVWRVSKYDTLHFLIQYMIFGENRCWTITIRCSPKTANQTEARITYSYIGLDATGDQISRHFIERIYQHDLKDWEEEINHYLVSKGDAGNPS